ncbi:Sec-independent protein translocase, TatC subunit [Maridesulfovibrio hydrothermalis AM13 = DSM 14728]|uniref:Sec-independent protein translocase protein TatC n=1 Tax=Maridesulfovibrio hydrothermalis AM13 = DSM 14728 TaxID=1121451 RepID=L0R5Y3_9BACT|nr:twin-arginine translocase subunit TatC [Maridesulfovibrio hydrothermalis]CCO22098.1 Sec-independent protein translocase, TatC subunit [Maridesulfovibrio hydrothermalis AM13 = DSM 14728]
MSSAEKDSHEVGQENREEKEKVEETAADSTDTPEDGSAQSSEQSSEESSEANDSLPAEKGEIAEYADDSEEPDDDELDEDEEPMTFLQHLDELRKRLLRILIACVVGFLACYSFAKPLFALLMAPLVVYLPENSTLIFTSLPEGFVTYLKVAFVAGFFVVSPYIFSQIWGFIAPGLYEHERKWMIPLAFLSAFFFVGGAMFGYYVVFPFGCEFFMGFADEFIRPMPTLREYLGFSLKLLFAFGVIFELPLFIFFLARLGVVTAEGLRSKRKYAILVCFICSAILTPPDVMTQTLMAGPLIFLYEVGIWVAYFFGKRGGRKLKKEQEMEGDNDPDDSGPDGGSAGAESGSDEGGPSSDESVSKAADPKTSQNDDTAGKKKDKKTKDKGPDYDEDMIEM